MSNTTEPSVGVDFVAGWVAGAVAVVAVQPVDTYLTRWQANTTARGGGGWFRGAYPMVATVPFQNALLMGGYGVGQQWYSSNYFQHDGEQKQYSTAKLGAIFVGGCTGGILQSFLMSPVELVKVTQQCAAPSLETSATTTMTLLQNFQARPALWGFVAYDMCKTAMTQSNNSNNTSTNYLYEIPLVSGAVAATVAWGVGYPFDLIKTRIQATASSSYSSNNVSILQTARDIMANDGFVGLYRGFGLKLVRSIPASMISFSVYEAVKDQLIQLGY